MAHGPLVSTEYMSSAQNNVGQVKNWAYPEFMRRVLKRNKNGKLYKSAYHIYCNYAPL